MKIRFLALPDADDYPNLAIFAYNPGEVVYPCEATPSVYLIQVEWVCPAGDDRDDPDVDGYTTYRHLSQVEGLPHIEIEEDSLDEAIETFHQRGGWMALAPS